LLQHLKKEKKYNKPEQEALLLLIKWDKIYNRESAAPAIFDMTLLKLVKNLVSDELEKEEWNAYNKSMLAGKYLVYNAFNTNNSTWSDNIKTPEKETFHQIVVQSFKNAVSSLANKYGNINQMKWGKVHQLKLKHPLGKVAILDKLFHLNRNYAAPGGANTVNPFTYPTNKAFEADMGASEKHIFNTADWNQSYSILPTGISGNPASTFYCDQTKDYMNGKVYKDIFSVEKVKSNAKYITVFNK